jgi:hypothetical protein
MRRRMRMKRQPERQRGSWEPKTSSRLLSAMLVQNLEM